MVKVVGQPGCDYCVQAQELLEVYEIPFNYVSLKDFTIKEKEEFKTKFGSAPQIWFGPKHIGGFKELVEYLK